LFVLFSYMLLTFLCINFFTFCTSIFCITVTLSAFCITVYVSIISMYTLPPGISPIAVGNK
jgi:hypothetical protein